MTDLLKATLGERMVALLEAARGTESAEGPLWPFSVAYEETKAEPDVISDSGATAVRGKVVIFPGESTVEELGVTSSGCVDVVIDEWRVVVIFGVKERAAQLEALRAVDQCLRGVLVEGCAGRITYQSGWNRVSAPASDSVYAFARDFVTNRDELYDTVGYVPPVLGFPLTLPFTLVSA